MPTLRLDMIQLSKYHWHIVSPKGHIIQNNLSFSNRYRAEEYVKNYISSYVNWSYTVITLEEENNNERSKTGN
jgi:hypothetical protein